MSALTNAAFADDESREVGWLRFRRIVPELVSSDFVGWGVSYSVNADGTTTQHVATAPKKIPDGMFNKYGWALRFVDGVLCYVQNLNDIKSDWRVVCDGRAWEFSKDVLLSNPIGKSVHPAPPFQYTEQPVNLPHPLLPFISSVFELSDTVDNSDEAGLSASDKRIRFGEYLREYWDAVAEIVANGMPEDIARERACRLIFGNPTLLQPVDIAEYREWKSFGYFDALMREVTLCRVGRHRGPLPAPLPDGAPLPKVVKSTKRIRDFPSDQTQDAYGTSCDPSKASLADLGKPFTDDYPEHRMTKFNIGTGPADDYEREVDEETYVSGVNALEQEAELAAELESEPEHKPVQEQSEEARIEEAARSAASDDESDTPSDLDAMTADAIQRRDLYDGTTEEDELPTRPASSGALKFLQDIEAGKRDALLQSIAQGSANLVELQQLAPPCACGCGKPSRPEMRSPYASETHKRRAQKRRERASI